MKKLFFILAVAVGFAFTNTATAQSSTEDFTLEITTETSRDALNQMRLDLEEQGVTFKYNPSFDANRVLNGIKAQVTFDNGQSMQYALNPMSAGQALVIERKTNENGEVEYFLGQK